MGYTETQIFVDWLNGCMSTCIDSSLWWDNEDKDYVDDDDDSCNKTLNAFYALDIDLSVLIYLMLIVNQ